MGAGHLYQDSIDNSLEVALENLPEFVLYLKKLKKKAERKNYEEFKNQLRKQEGKEEKEIFHGEDIIDDIMSTAMPRNFAFEQAFRTKTGKAAVLLYEYLSDKKVYKQDEWLQKSDQKFDEWVDDDSRLKRLASRAYTLLKMIW